MPLEYECDTEEPIFDVAPTNYRAAAAELQQFLAQWADRWIETSPHWLCGEVDHMVML